MRIWGILWKCVHLTTITRSMGDLNYTLFAKYRANKGCMHHFDAEAGVPSSISEKKNHLNSVSFNQF
jgi:hypothetical protein